MMKFKIFTLASTILSISCSNYQKSASAQKKVSLIKSDVLLESSAYQSFSNPKRKDFVYLTISGKTILGGTAILKTINEAGEEVHCVTFPSTDLIQSEYLTANSSLKEAHIREVVDGFFVSDLDDNTKRKETYAGI